MLLALLAAAAIQATSAQPASVEQQLRAYDQALLDAIAPGDRALWDKWLAPGAVYIDENGTIMQRAQFLASLKPLPAGNSGHIAITSYQAQVLDNVALVVHRDDEREDYHGIPLRAGYLMSETWIKQGADWRLAMVHAYVVAKDPPAIQSSAQQLDQYQGHYRAAADLSYVISREGDHLVGLRQGLPPVTLAQEATDVFFVRGHPRERKIFRRDAHGGIVDFVDRREGEDLVFVRGK